jgi:hypothetical protein
VISIDLKGAEQFIAKSRKARGLFTRTVYRSLKRSLRKPATERRRTTRTVPMIRAMLRSPWGKKDRNRLTSRVKVIGPWVEGNAINAGIGMYGYAASVRTGDRIPPHVIPTRSGGAIRHPGARVIPQIGGSRDFREVNAVLRQLEQDVHEMLERVYGL